MEARAFFLLVVLSLALVGCSMPAAPLAAVTVLEGRGVIPDVEVALDRGLLLQGIDSQLEAAIEYIEKQASE